MKVRDIFKQRVSPSFYFSAGFFLVCMSLDFYFTNSLSGGDYTMEANPVGRLWWQITGPFRFIEIPIYAIVILSTAYVINYKNKFFPLFWLNLLAFNHLLGFLTWLPNINLNFIYTIIKQDWALGYAFSLCNVFLSLPLTLFQLALGKAYRKV